MVLYVIFVFLKTSLYLASLHRIVDCLTLAKQLGRDRGLKRNLRSDDALVTKQNAQGQRSRVQNIRPFRKVYQ